MKKAKQFLIALTAAVMLLSMSAVAFAAETGTGFVDVSSDAWYAGSVAYVHDNGIMNGISDTAFSPNGTMTRAMLATVLYRAAGSPATGERANFNDVADNAYYANAVAWASANGIVTGYGDGLFGSEDPVSHENCRRKNIIGQRHFWFDV